MPPRRHLGGCRQSNEQEVNQGQEDGSAQPQQRWTAMATEVHHCVILDPAFENATEARGNTGTERRNAGQGPR